ncbi:hypothetical protein [Pedobacter zeae]|uniref:Uncharacterized protein n=1 Tax=Pedobacter zeae TaxID=1737356 RepID=A0A7W6KDS0_9SPHI|nr:hypothetical protein [Pedobacter zeae]MBB4109931.1 hypothetical protein [Pedobacter zeae]
MKTNVQFFIAEAAPLYALLRYTPCLLQPGLIFKASRHWTSLFPASTKPSFLNLMGVASPIFHLDKNGQQD